jgi:hypothetical protein
MPEVLTGNVSSLLLSDFSEKHSYYTLTHKLQASQEFLCQEIFTETLL